MIPTERPWLVVSTGCPAGIGPEVSVAAAVRARGARVVLVGDVPTLRRAAELVGVAQERLTEGGERGRVRLLQAGPPLREADRRPGRPTCRAGAAQLEYVRVAHELVSGRRDAALVTGPVSKEAIAKSGAPGSEGFLGHTEWLAAREPGRHGVMCFASERLVCSLVTTHLPLAEVPSALSVEGVRDATVALGELLLAMGKQAPRIAVVSLNPHAGEGELLGTEERTTIVPGARQAARRLGRRVTVMGPIGAETAFRRAAAGELQGVVAMYHDQATIPMKLIAFGQAVNVTLGLELVRTSVDHGTGYDIAWQARAEPRGMQAALELARQLLRWRQRETLGLLPRRVPALGSRA